MKRKVDFRLRRLFWASVVLVVAGGVWAVLDVARPDPRRRNIELFPEMAYSPASTSYEPNAAFANGRTLQPPIEGTCARDTDVLRYGPARPGFENAEAEMRLCGRELSMPPRVADDATAAREIERGRVLYARFCACCHGTTGAGDGAVAARITAAQFPLASRATALNDGELYYVISRGSRSGVMAGYAGLIGADDRWRLVRYLRSMASQ